MIIPDSGDGNINLSIDLLNLGIWKELIIPDSGDGNKAVNEFPRDLFLKELIIPDSGDGNSEL